MKTSEEIRVLHIAAHPRPVVKLAEPPTRLIAAQLSPSRQIGRFADLPLKQSDAAKQLKVSTQALETGALLPELPNRQTTGQPCE